jgi:hypothetical protein
MDLYGKDAIRAHVDLSELVDSVTRRNGNGGNGDDQD